MSQLGKVKAFSLSSSAKKVLGKKDLEKQKKIADEEDAAKAYQEFVATFEDTPKQTKLFVRGNVINSSNGEELSATQSGKLYKPNKLHELETRKSAVEPSRPSEPLFKSEKPAKKRSEPKKKSNLELFKEELKLIQEEREERHRLKSQLKESGIKVAIKAEPEVGIKLADEYRIPGLGSFDTGDPNTTNIYLGNLNPKMTEPQLCQLFGKYGPLASVKIMWPRSDEERSRNRNCGFVAFMNRKDGERATKALNGKDIMEFEMKLGWGKAVPIPPHPIYIPPALMELTMPPPQSGLPFNAQPDINETISRDQWNEKENFGKVLQTSVVKVVVPTDRTLLCLIHRMVEFVVREGPMFEAMIMNREINNPTFRFLFDNQSPAHVYYRWRLFSVLQGEHPSKWRTEEFRMFEGGSLWKPPPLNPFLQGMPEELVEPSPPPSPERDKQKRKLERQTRPESKKGMLSESQRDRLEDLLRNLTPQRSKISEAMVYCIDHSESAEEIVDCIAESLAILETPLYRKIARLYLISDILHNCSVKVTNVSFFRKGFQSRLVHIFHDIHDTFVEIEGRLKAENFKQRVMACFRAWEDQAIYSPDFLIKLQNIFLGLVQRESEVQHKSHIEDDVDGVPIGESDIDGVPIDNIDGEPFVGTDSGSLPKFKPSKWETVDPDLVESQAMTTSKWDTLEPILDESAEDIDGKPYEPSPTQSGEDSRGSAFLEQLKHELSNSDSTKRAKLREIEVKVLRFQDELESGKRSKKSGLSVPQMVEEYRRKLLRKDRDDNEDYEKDRHSESSYSPRSKRRSRSRSRSRSPRSERSRERHRHRSRSRSPDSRSRRKRRSSSPHKRRK